MTVKYDLAPSEYFIDPINSKDNERIVELKISMNHYEDLYNAGSKNNVVEIGNVLGFYGYCEHECIDKFAQMPDISPAGEVKNIDALDFDFTGRDIISVSTIEHIGTTDYDNPIANEGQDAVDVLKKIEQESKSFFITFGPNYNNPLDNYVKSNLESYDWHGWVRTAIDKWDYTAQDMKVWDQITDDPWPFANGIILLRNKT